MSASADFAHPKPGDIPPGAGIYRIVNQAAGCEYVGSAVDLRRRHSVHRHALVHGNHHNARLQRAWDSGAAFRFEVVERVQDVGQLLSREQHYLDHPAGASRYNTCLVAGSVLGRPCAEETRRKVADALRGRKRPPEVGAKVSAALRGRKRGPMREETKAKIGAANRGHKHGLGRSPSADTRAKIAESNRGQKRSAEARAKMRATHLGKTLSAETRAKVSKSLRGRQKSPEHLARISEAIKAHWVLRRARASESATCCPPA